jgi:hypothetical protein
MDGIILARICKLFNLKPVFGTFSFLLFVDLLINQSFPVSGKENKEKLNPSN